MPIITCADCGEETKHWAKGTCRRCYHRKRVYERYHNDPEWRGRQLERGRLRKAKARKALRAETIVAYGGQCACCEEAATEFLTIDHINGREPGDRRTGTKLQEYLKKEGWPTGNYRLLCWNCNAALGIYGYCPHEGGINVA